MSDENDSNGTPSVESPAQGNAAKAHPAPAKASPAPEAPISEASDANRRVRRTRQIQPVESSEPSADGAPASPRPPSDDRPRSDNRPRSDARPRGEGRPRGGGRGPRADGDRARGPRGPRPPGGGRPRGRGDRPAVGQTEARRVFRQDVIAPVGAPGSPAGSPAGPPPAPQPPPKPHEKDKITLILHPAPKAAPERRKAKDRPKTAKEALREKTAKLAPKVEPKKSAPATIDPAWRAASEADAPAFLAQAGEAAEALAKAWMDEGNVVAIAAAARSEALSGKARKAARRALNVLKARGVEIPEAAPEPSVATESVEAPVASFIPPDATGAMFISISQRQPGGRYLVADAVIRQGVGVIQVSSGRIAGKQIRNWKNRVEDQFGAAPVEVPLDWARHRIAEARNQNDTSGQIVPLGFDNAQVLLGPPPAEEPPHPLADLEEAAHQTAAISKAILGSDRLHREPEFAAWMPDRPAIDELLRNVGEKVGPSGGQEEGAVDKALEEEIVAATDRFFSPELRKVIRARMRDAAISIRARKGDDAAREALSVAKGVEEAGLITAPPSEIPFLKSFFQKAIAVMLRQSQGQLRVPVRQAERA
jgi:hypothetical protein